ncbi:hypothetical protein BDQ94DRAFT_151858 [Aspergillus welwitschiae]|uniref:Uncharacterized protein n=1 Tax=Aspergillus welwitschiae TaxID=1341132 RepID=A0A3F3PNQ8_9EURO|nr:hypothetical protein BDQ94DRAFT_151858 [Aspergillus welwitschiae]RDH28575.1 hypothetical protein BDQ94DRAFT_151858 [Aspergillus welwitschiae]
MEKGTETSNLRTAASVTGVRIRVLCSNGCCGCLGAGLLGALHTATISKGPVIAALLS